MDPGEGSLRNGPCPACHDQIALSSWQAGDNLAAYMSFTCVKVHESTDSLVSCRVSAITQLNLYW